MSPAGIAVVVSLCLSAAVWGGMRVRRLLPEHHLSSDTRDTVKLAMGLVGTMSALLLGLLVSSAKGSYDAERVQVIQMAAKVVFLDRVLEDYGPGAADARHRLRGVVEEFVRRTWPEASGQPGAPPAPGSAAGEALFGDIERLAPADDLQRSLKTQATSLALDLGQQRVLLLEQSISAISGPMLAVVICWLVIIFSGFSVLAPPNGTALLALLVSALAVAGAIFLILELDLPFGGIVRISGQPMLDALSRLAR
jgi:hypothetical protein